MYIMQNCDTRHITMKNTTHKILKCIKEHEGISRSKLMRINRINKKDFDKIVEHLKTVGAIEPFTDFEIKRNPTCYRVASDVPVHHITEMNCAQCGVVLTDCNISDIMNKKGYPFCTVCANRTSGAFITHKTCEWSSVQFGTNFAETALSKVFKDVERAKNCNPCYDFVCNHGKKIDVKAACVNTKRQWIFAIDKNDVADYFLLAAFDNRVDLNLVHLWLIPGHVLNDLQGASIGAKTSKWSEYELPVDKAIECCNIEKSHAVNSESLLLDERAIWVIPKIDFR